MLLAAQSALQRPPGGATTEIWNLESLRETPTVHGRTEPALITAQRPNLQSGI
jgi:hypothetical protein